MLTSLTIIIPTGNERLRDMARSVRDRYKASASVRVDKHQNFDFLVSPAVSFVYTPSQKTTLRTSFSSAIH